MEQNMDTVKPSKALNDDSIDNVICPAAEKVSLGCVGYRFSKFFPGYGYFEGIVIKIRPGADHGKDRRCVYSDGDVEDLSLKDLQALARKRKFQGGDTVEMRGADTANYSNENESNKLEENNESENIKNENEGFCDKSSIILNDSVSKKKRKRVKYSKNGCSGVASRTCQQGNSSCFKYSDNEKEQKTSDRKMTMCNNESTYVNPNMNGIESNTNKSACGDERDRDSVIECTNIEKDRNEIVCIRVDVNEEGKTKIDKNIGVEIQEKKKLQSSNMLNGNVNIEASESKIPDKLLKNKGKNTAQMNIKSVKQQKEIYENSNLHQSFVENSPKLTTAYLFEVASEFLPTDIAAEATLELPKNFSKAVEVEDENEVCLEKLASLLGASDTRNPRLESRKMGTVPKEIIKSRVTGGSDHLDVCHSYKAKINKFSYRETIKNENAVLAKCTSVDDKAPQRKIDNLRESENENMSKFSSISSCDSLTNESLVLLMNVKAGKRHGLKVFNIQDTKRTVGEVLMEHPYGWIEVVMSGDVKKGRARNYAVVPNHYETGDKVDLNIPLPDDTLKIIKSDTSQCPLKDCSIESSNCQTELSPLEKSQTTSSTEYKISIDNLFYWRCTCEAINNYKMANCNICGSERNESCSLSALLDIAEHAVRKSSNYETVVEAIPLIHRAAFPKEVLTSLLPNAQLSEISPPPSRLDSYFYWNCRSCTMANSYKRVTCKACHLKKDSRTHSSILLEIAKEAALNAYSLEDALEAVLPVHKPAIPEIVLNSLVTCSFIISKGKRRCLRQKAPGSDYCHLHTDPSMMAPISNEVKCPKAKSDPGDLVSNSGIKSNKDDSTKKQSQDVSSPLSQNIISLTLSIINSLRKKITPHHVNKLDWNINCIEDAIISQEHAPFPIGLRVRRFFPSYGFHDAIITRIQRQIVTKPKGKARPVFLYRLLYNDGDSEDFYHHQINSLRQIYNQRNVDPTAPAYEQLLPGTLFETFVGFVEIVNVTRDYTSGIYEGKDGRVCIKFCRPGESWSMHEIELIQLQLVVIRKLQRNETIKVGPGGVKSCVSEEIIPDDHSKIWENEYGSKLNVANSQSVLFAPSKGKPSPSPVLEWSVTGNHLYDDGDNAKYAQSLESKHTDNDVMVAPGLWMSRKPIPVEVDDEGESDDSNDQKDVSTFDEDYCCIRPGAKNPGGWDPAGGLHSVVWDPFKILICDICKSGKDENRILICDKCYRGYHTYCVRPVIVNIPSEQWLCSRCTEGACEKATFEAGAEELMREPRKISSFLSFPFKDPSQFCYMYKESLDIFSPTTDKAKKLLSLGPLSDRKPTKKLGMLYVSHTKNRYLWHLPVPLSMPKLFCRSLATMVAAMKYCGMEQYSEHLVYESENGVTESMNDANLNLGKIEALSKLNLDIFSRYKENLKSGVYPPIQIVNDNDIGFTVEALAVIPRHTIITEYVGDVTTVERSYDTSSDSLMMLLDTGDPKTSLIIDPTRRGNIARFLSGINNRSHMSRRKANVRTRRFSYEGKCRIVLFTSKQLEPKDTLHYDYNAGNEGKSVAEWAETGFYDTSNFV